MKNFHKWNSELQPDHQISRELEHLGEMVWDACASECAKLCRDFAKSHKDTEPSRSYTFADERWKKVLEDLGNYIDDH